jgi:hypothetical protein
LLLALRQCLCAIVVGERVIHHLFAAILLLFVFAGLCLVCRTRTRLSGIGLRASLAHCADLELLFHALHLLVALNGLAVLFFLTQQLGLAFIDVIHDRLVSYAEQERETHLQVGGRQVVLGAADHETTRGEVLARGCSLGDLIGFDPVRRGQYLRVPRLAVTHGKTACLV